MRFVLICDPYSGQIACYGSDHQVQVDLSVILSLTVLCYNKHPMSPLLALGHRMGHGWWYGCLLAGLICVR